MRAIVYHKAGNITTDGALSDTTLASPHVKDHDILVAISAISVNPVDTKIRQNVMPSDPQGKVIGWDAAGTVVAIGDKVRKFKIGDEVYYSGELDKAGCNAELQVVHEDLVALKPKTLSMSEAAALPLTSLTAWESLFDGLRVNDPIPGAAPAIVIIGAAGGVGSIMIQLVKALTNLVVIATASRPETRQWVKNLGADYVINHHLDLNQQIIDLSIGQPAFVFCAQQTGDHQQAIADFIAPRGRLCLIDDPVDFNIGLFKRKSITIAWEYMFNRPLFNLPDTALHGQILHRLAQLIDAQQLRSTLQQTLSPINAHTLTQAHQRLESKQVLGKIVITGWDI